MRIAIIGTGNVGCTLAADLSNKGHLVALVKSSQTPSPYFDMIRDNGTVKVHDGYIGNYESRVSCFDASQYEEVIPPADVIIITVQTNYHESVMKGISDYLRDGQTVVFEPGYLSTCYLLKHCKKDILSIEAESSPIDCRMDTEGCCSVLFKNVMNPIGIYPKEKQAEARRVLESLQYPYRITENVIEAALHNPNLVVHTVGALFSIPRIETTQGEYWMYKEVFSPHVWTVCEALDEEVMDVLEASGIKRRQRYVEACQERNFIDDRRDPLQAFFDYALNSSPKGPAVPDSRYITEDVSQGLVLLESLGACFGVDTPVASSLITIASKSLGVDFRAQGRTIEKLGSDNLRKILDNSQAAI